MDYHETINVLTASSAPTADGAVPLAKAVFIWLTDKLLPPALLAFAVSWGIPRALERYKGRREHFYKTIDTLRAQLQALQNAAASYWNKSYNIKQSPIDEANLEFLLGDVRGLILLAAEAGAPDLYATPTSPAVVAVGELIDAVTGGDYRSKSRAADPSRSARTNAAALHLLSLLAKTRWDVVDRGMKKRRATR